MNFLFLVVALSSVAVINAGMDGPELEEGLKLALDQFFQVHLNKSLHGDERATQLRALTHPLFIYADADKDGFVSKEELKAFMKKVTPYVLPKVLAHASEKERQEAQEELDKGFRKMIERSFAYMDDDRNGQLSLQEVLNAIQ